MEKTISVKVSADSSSRTVSFKIRKEGDKIVSGFYVEEELMGDFEFTEEAFNNFCLDLFNEHKKLLSTNLAPAHKYEYLTELRAVPTSPDIVQTYVNEWAQKGWRLVCIAPSTPVGYEYYHYERPLRQYEKPILNQKQ